MSRYLFESQWILTTGVIEVHRYGYQVLQRRRGWMWFKRVNLKLHAREMVCHHKVEVGKIIDNPFRDEIERLGRLLPYTMSLMWVPSLQEWWLGRPEDILRSQCSCITVNQFRNRMTGLFYTCPW